MADISGYESGILYTLIRGVLTSRPWRHWHWKNDGRWCRKKRKGRRRWKTLKRRSCYLGVYQRNWCSADTVSYCCRLQKLVNPAHTITTQNIIFLRPRPISRVSLSKFCVHLLPHPTHILRPNSLNPGERSTVKKKHFLLSTVPPITEKALLCVKVPRLHLLLALITTVLRWR